MSESGDKEVKASLFQDEEAPAQEEAAPAADAAPELPKERIKRPARPDDASHKQKVDALQDIINMNKKRGEEIKQILDDRKAGKSAGSSGQQAIKNKLAELRNQWQTVLKQKQQLRAQMETASKTRDAVRSSLRDLKSNMKFTTVEQIDEAIDKLEHRMQHSSLSLNEEKQVLDDIRKLKASRAAVGEYSEKLEVLAQDDSSRAELMGGIKSLDEELTKIRAEEDVHRAELAALREKEAETSSDVPALIAERNEVREVCKQAYEKIKDLRAEHDAVWTEFKAQEKLWRAQQDVDRAARREAAAAERKARDAERAARLAEMAPEPFDREVIMCDQLKAYLGRFAGASAAATSGAAAEPAKEVAALDGMKVFARKKEDEEDEWMLSSGKVGKKGKAKGKKSGGNTAAAPAAGSDKIVHSLDMLEAFATLKISVPTSSAAVPGILSTVEELKADFLKKRDEVKAAKEAEAPAAEANGGDAEIEEGEIVEAAPSAAAPAAAKKKAGGKKAAPALLPTLDDVTSWPAMGETPAAPAAAEEEEADEEEAAAAAAEEAVAPLKAAADGGVSVAFTVSDSAGVTLAISAGSD